MLAYILNVEGSGYRQSNVFHLDPDTKLLVPVELDRIEMVGFPPYPFRSHGDLAQVWPYDRMPTRVIVDGQPADNLTTKLKSMPDGASGMVIGRYDPQKDSAISRSRESVMDAVRKGRLMEKIRGLEGGQTVMAAYFRFSPRMLAESAQLEMALLEQEPGLLRP
ncbi:MAG: hypothetical protein HY516_02730 [Candidatus Aenigmarchaeota archaeon]|nr:hypothetical protein [Candidatus Aenigmarchaeota archaeon]